MTLTFKANPAVGDVQQQPNGLQYQYDGVKWTSIGSYGTGSINDIKKLDNISLDFDDTRTTFDLKIDNKTVYVSSELVLNISIGGVKLDPSDYTLSAQNTQITFTEAPLKGFSFTGIIESRLPTSEIDDAAISTQKLTDDSVTTAKLADDCVTMHQIAENAVGSNQINAQSIFNSDINNNAAIAQSKLNIADATTSASGYMSGSDKSKLDNVEAAATADMTDAEIKTAYENNSDTNAFTDAEKTKLSGIESGATGDQTSAEIRTLVESATDSNVFTDADHTKLDNIDVTNDKLSVDSNNKFVFTGATGQYPTITINHSDNTVEGEVIRFERTDSNNARFHSLKAKSHSSDTDANYLSFHIHDRSSINSQVEQLKITPNSVKFNYDGVTKVKTSAGGLQFNSGSALNLPTNSPINIGDSANLVLKYNGTNSIIKDNGDGMLLLLGSQIAIRNTSSTENIAIFKPDEGVTLYYDNKLRGETTAEGFKITGEANSDTANTGLNRTLDLRNNSLGNPAEAIRFSRTESVVRYHSLISSNSTNTADNFIKFNIHDGAGAPYTGQVTQLLIDDDKVSLSYDGTEKAVTSATGFDVTGKLTCTGDLELPDGADIKLGNGDFRIFHDDSNGLNYIQPHNNGPLIIKGSSGEIAKFVPGAEISLRHSNNVKLETTSSGITVTGSVTTQDMNMSNLNGTANEVDSTKGSWSIQEGADDLFLINRVNGKKYKFNLTEIN